jgi:hypothetical protein
MTVTSPWVVSQYLPCISQPELDKTLVPTLTPTASPSQLNYTELRLPCTRHASFVLHHGIAGDIILENAFVQHSCEYSLLIDKVRYNTPL